MIRETETCNKPPGKNLKQINTQMPLIKYRYIYSSVLNARPTNVFRSLIRSNIFEHHVCCGGTRDVATYVISASGFEKERSIRAVGFTSQVTISDT